MALLRPGGHALTDRGLELAGLWPGSRMLDIGCGEGDTVAYLQDEKGMQAEGIDMNLVRISRAKELHPGINVSFGDGEFLDNYTSYTFDGILMESSLSLINMPDEAMHEAWCVLKKGGKLIISDLYEKDPDRKQMQAVRIEAERQSRMPHKEGDCEDRGLKYVSFRFEGAFYQRPLIRQLEETGFQIIAVEDHTPELEEWLNQQSLSQLNQYLKTEIGGLKRNIGYCQIVAAKPL